MCKGELVNSYAALRQPLQDYEQLQSKSGCCEFRAPAFTIAGFFLLTDGLAHMHHGFFAVLGRNISMSFFGMINGLF